VHSGVIKQPHILLRTLKRAIKFKQIRFVCLIAPFLEPLLFLLYKNGYISGYCVVEQLVFENQVFLKIVVLAKYGGNFEHALHNCHIFTARSIGITEVRRLQRQNVSVLIQTFKQFYLVKPGDKKIASGFLVASFV
jgi:hypothetical protein